MIRGRDVRGSVLDLAAGSGAWLSRLCDAGFHPLCGVEFNSAAFRFPNARHVAADLNGPFASEIGGMFHLVTAIEIIEHLNSPYDFLRQAYGFVKPGGYLLVSTPNFANLVGRLKLLRSGELRYFDAAQYRYNHHISPIPAEVMTLMLQDVGFEVIERRSAGSFMTRPVRALLSAATAALRPLLRRLSTGEVSLFLARRPTA